VLFLVFQLGEHRYAIDASQIAEVLPLVAINTIARAPEEVAGIFVYRGAPVPVIDLSQLFEGRPAERRLSTRVIIVRYPSGSGDTRLLGLIAEKATETIRREACDFVDSGVLNERAPYLGSVATDARGLVQRVDVARLLTARHQAWFEQPEEQEWPSPTSKTC
jgi:chemotaxis-related protein WspB